MFGREKREKVRKKFYKQFLKEIRKAMDGLAHLGLEKEELIKKLEADSKTWIDELSYIDADSFKAGICFATSYMLKAKEQKPEKEPYVV